MKYEESHVQLITDLLEWLYRFCFSRVGFCRNTALFHPGEAALSQWGWNKGSFCWLGSTESTSVLQSCIIFCWESSLNWALLPWSIHDAASLLIPSSGVKRGKQQNIKKHIHHRQNSQQLLSIKSTPCDVSTAAVPYHDKKLSRVEEAVRPRHWMNKPSRRGTKARLVQSGISINYFSNWIDTRCIGLCWGNLCQIYFMVLFLCIKNPPLLWWLSLKAWCEFSWQLGWKSISPFPNECCQ